MGAERRQRIEAIFDEALDRPSSQRDAFLDSACAGDPELRAEAEALLAAHERAEGILEADAIGAAASLIPDQFVHESIGPYRIVDELGRGGMGVVYLAEREAAGVVQRVAIKIIQRGSRSDELRKRFELEGRVLASLDHPNIARLIDAGLTEEGDPFFVMEHVDGLPIDEYCSLKDLSIEERLRLFCTVARAVHHAHQNLVVHRDLKPSNIWVTVDGDVKLLDFGIAKLLEPSAMGLSRPLTGTGVRVMTPDYASPEQVCAEPITVATDVYGLAVVLYELLTERLPIELAGRSPGSWARIVMREKPPPPSSAVGFEFRDRQHRLRGDLDNIALKALSKRPDQRYASPVELAEDIERHLDGQPVIAGEDALVQRSANFGPPNVRVFAAGVTVTAVLLVLSGYFINSTLQERQAGLELEQARFETARSAQLSDLLIGLFDSPTADEATLDTTIARSLLERGLAQAGRLEDQPDAKAQLLTAMGHVHRRLGEYEPAEALLLEAFEIRRGLGDADSRLAETARELVALYQTWDRPLEAASYRSIAGG